MTITFTMPMALPSTSNLREHWAVRARRAKAQRQQAFITAFYFPAQNGKNVGCHWREVSLAPTIPTPVLVTITRIAPRELDSDNCITACKNVRDGITDALGLPSDRDPRIRFEYAQERGKPAAVRVEIRSEP